MPLVWIVDDDDDDLLLLELAFGDIGRKISLESARDGLALMEMLDERRGGGADQGLPDFIMMDLNMPRMDGFEALRRLKADPSIADLPVIVMTTSDSSDDKQRVIDLGAEKFLTKPPRIADLTGMIDGLVDTYCEAA